MFLPVLAHPGCPGLSPESHKMVVELVVVVVVHIFIEDGQFAVKS